MFSRQQRLGKRSDILHVYRKGQRFHSKEFRVSVLQTKKEANDDAETIEVAKIRIAVVVPNKVSKKATRRNLLKRRIRVALKGLPLDMSMNADIVVTANPGTLDLTVQRISDILQTLFSKARILQS